jgi:hypothetical protein
MDSSPCLAWLQQNRLQIYDLKKFAKQDTRRTLPAIDNIFSVHSCQIQQFLCKDEEYVFTHVLLNISLYPLYKHQQWIPEVLKPYQLTVAIRYGPFQFYSRTSLLLGDFNGDPLAADDSSTSR